MKIAIVSCLLIVLVGCATICADLPTIPLGVLNPLCPAATPTPTATLK